MQRNAYVTGLGACLPNAPVTNDAIERVLGRLPGQSAAVRRRALMNNGIRSRHYAISPESGEITHTNAAMTAEAVQAACETAGLSIADIACLACGTSSADQLIPSHASMVHAAIGCPPCEVLATSGVCCSGVGAFKYGYLNVAGGLCHTAVVTGSELASPILRASHFEPQLRRESGQNGKRTKIDFDNEFLRWMLSDGAGAWVVTAEKHPARPSLRIDWVDLISFASEADICMYMGMRKTQSGAFESYRIANDEKDLVGAGFMNLAQDVRVLADLLPKLMKTATREMLQRRALSPDAVDWLLPHYSSQWFRQPLYDGFAGIGFEIPFERWFTNLPTKGNTGAASIYIMLEELIASGRVQRGERILCLVPESARMMFGFIHFTVV